MFLSKSNWIHTAIDWFVYLCDQINVIPLYGNWYNNCVELFFPFIWWRLFFFLSVFSFTCYLEKVSELVNKEGLFLRHSILKHIYTKYTGNSTNMKIHHKQFKFISWKWTEKIKRKKEHNSCYNTEAKNWVRIFFASAFVRDNLLLE